MTMPTLLLSPDGSRDRNGSISVTTGSGVTVVAGQYGQAWRREGAGANSPLVNNAYINSPEGTILTRGMFLTDPVSPTVQKYFVSSYVSASNRVYIGRRPSPGFQTYGLAGSTPISGGEALPDETPMALAISWSGGVASVYRDGVVKAGPTAFTGDIPSTATIDLMPSAYVQVESVLIYDTALPIAEIERLSAMPEAWTWGSVRPESDTPSGGDDGNGQHRVLTPFSSYSGIPLQFLTEEGGRLADWHRDLIINEAKVAASNRTNYQADGWGDWEISTRVLVQTEEDWRRLSTARGIRADLWMPAGATAEAPPSIIEHRHGVDYAIFNQVMLMSVVRGSVRRVGHGRVLARLVFRRRSEEEYIW